MPACRRCLGLALPRHVRSEASGRLRQVWQLPRRVPGVSSCPPNEVQTHLRRGLEWLEKYNTRREANTRTHTHMRGLIMGRKHFFSLLIRMLQMAVKCARHFLKELDVWRGLQKEKGAEWSCSRRGCFSGHPVTSATPFVSDPGSDLGGNPFQRLSANPFASAGQAGRRAPAARWPP